MEKATVAKGEYEKKMLAVLADVYKGQEVPTSVNESNGRLHRIMAESMNAQHIVEVGTGDGYATIWMGLAAKKTGGRITTFQVDAKRSAKARENFKRAEMSEIITMIEGNAHEQIKSLKNPIANSRIPAIQIELSLGFNAGSLMY